VLLIFFGLYTNLKKKILETCYSRNKVFPKRKKHNIFKCKGERERERDCTMRFLDWFESTNFTSNINQLTLK